MEDRNAITTLAKPQMTKEDWIFISAKHRPYQTLYINLPRKAFSLCTGVAPAVWSTQQSQAHRNFSLKISST